MYAFSLSPRLSLYATQTRIPTFDPFVPDSRRRDAGEVTRYGCWDFKKAGEDASDIVITGELVRTRPHPTIPLYLWGDDARK
jgi:hypothetical protein